MSEFDNIFANAPREGETIDQVLDGLSPEVDKEQEVEKPAESQTEKEPDLKQNEAWKEIRQAREEAEAKARQLEERLNALETAPKEEKQEKSEFVTSLVGENEDVDRKWRQERENLKDEVKREMIQEQVRAQEKEAEQVQYWNKWTQDRFSEVEQEFNVNFTANPNLKNELAKLMQETTPTDAQGNLDYRKGMSLLQRLQKAEDKEQETKTQVKKNIADATVSKETSSKEAKNYLTRNDLRGGWRGLIGKE